MLVFLNLFFVLVYGYLLVNEIRENKTVQAALSSAIVSINLVQLVLHLVKA